MSHLEVQRAQSWGWLNKSLAAGPVPQRGHPILGTAQGMQTVGAGGGGGGSGVLAGGLFRANTGAVLGTLGQLSA